MAKSKYESVLVVSCKLDDEGIEAIVKKFQDLIEANGEMNEVTVWGKRELAYEIQKQRVGYYVIFNFTAEPDFPAELDRVYNITEGVLRSLIVTVGE